MPELVVALDFQAPAEALDMARCLQSVTGPGQPKLWMKVGLELFVAGGPDIVRSLKHMGFRVFLDLKFLDIPNTVRGAVRSAVKSGADMLNIHAIGGLEMARTAVAARDGAADELGLSEKPLLLAVTVLTSMQDTDTPILRGREAGDVALDLAKLARQAGLDGVVCSGREVASIKAECGAEFVCLTPGIRLPDPLSEADDQRRVMTPEAAVAAGSDFLVVGRPITRALEGKGGPVALAREMLGRMASASAAGKV
ncbi:MAG: orotidine 5'-phosphate decarboxylase [Desulfovibrionaceae bacterium CG1_02_65_16]|nr:MAG: orotidine 5'-phosphate decarboxylase [Desulfovibrionaceae bacterium CG1_02_65_16]